MDEWRMALAALSEAERHINLIESGHRTVADTEELAQGEHRE